MPFKLNAKIHVLVLDLQNNAYCTSFCDLTLLLSGWLFYGLSSLQ